MNLDPNVSLEENITTMVTALNTIKENFKTNTNVKITDFNRIEDVAVNFSTTSFSELRPEVQNRLNILYRDKMKTEIESLIDTLRNAAIDIENYKNIIFS